MSIRRTRGARSPRTVEVYPDDDVQPGRYFGKSGRSWKGNRKLMQLCKQVERSAALTLASLCDSAALLGASVAAVEPAPDSGRLKVAVVLASGKSVDEVMEAKEALFRATPTFREEVGRSVHRKRVPELVFDVRLDGEAIRG